jgi:hypothetical protein
LIWLLLFLLWYFGRRLQYLSLCSSCIHRIVSNTQSAMARTLHL